MSSGQLTSLNLSQNLITSEGITQFCQIIKFSPAVRLRHLDLSQNLLGDEGAEAIASFLSQNATLLRLFITDCGVTDQGANQILSALRTNKTLQQMQYGGQTKTANVISK